VCLKLDFVFHKLIPHKILQLASTNCISLLVPGFSSLDNEWKSFCISSRSVCVCVCVCLTTHHKDYIRWWLGLLRKVDKSLDEPHPRSVHPFTRQMALHTLHVIHGICSLSPVISGYTEGSTKYIWEGFWLNPWIKVLVQNLSRSFVHEIPTFLWNEMYPHRFHKSLPLHSIKKEDGSVFRKHFLPADPFWLRKIATDPHILADVNTGCPDDRYPKLKIYIPELTFDSYEYIPVAHWFELTDSRLLRGYRGFLNPYPANVENMVSS